MSASLTAGTDSGCTGTPPRRPTDSSCATSAPPGGVAEDHDDWLLTTLGRAVLASIFTVVSGDPLMILATDGIDSLGRGELERIVREHAGDPQALANALVTAPDVDDAGDRDDVTIAVLLAE